MSKPKLMIADCPSGDSLATHQVLPWSHGDIVLILGEIENMPDHYAVACQDGKVYFGYHLDNFREPGENEV